MRAEQPRRARGPRTGQADTRAAIIAGARQAFEAHGYDTASLRGIARRAGVDARLVHHYFAGKEDLFVAAMALPIQPAELLEQLDDAEGAGERIVRLFFRVWDSEEGRRSFKALAGAATTNERAATMMREFIKRAVVGRATAIFEGPDAELRATLLAAQMAGVAQLRYILRMEPLASASVEEIVRLLAPLAQALRDPKPR